MEELTEDDARYLIVKSTGDDGTEQNVAFVHFRYDLDFDMEVLYW